MLQFSAACVRFCTHKLDFCTFHHWVYMRIKTISIAAWGFLGPLLLNLSISGVVFADQQPPSKKHHKSAKQTAKQMQQAAPQPSVPTGPLPALPLDQIPSSAPQVDYKNSQLTIVSRNSTLGDILRAVHAQTGANIDMPSNSTERVVGYFGPGPARDVLATLLNGSHFNYVLLGSPTNSSVLDRVILITKSGPDEVAPTVQANAAGETGLPQQPTRMGERGMPQVPQDADANADTTDDPQDEVDDTAAAPPDDAATQQQQQAPQPQLKTPEQLLQELQRQQMIQQQQQQQNGGTPQGFPAPQPFQQNPQQ